MVSRVQFHSVPYRASQPLTEVKIDNNKPIEALVDTGASAGIAVIDSQISVLGLKLTDKINDEYGRVRLADGTVIAVDFYKAEVDVNGEKRKVGLTVLHPNIVLGSAEGEPKPVLLGRGFLNYYDVLFSGINKQLTFSK